MTQQPVTFQHATVAEAAEILGVSTQTVRRMIRRGQLQGERVHRPQGSTYVVSLPVDAPAGDTDATATQQPPPNVSRSNATGPAQAEAMVSLIQTTIATVLGPLVGQIDAQRQTIERQADQLVCQAGTIGRLEAENAALMASQAKHGAILTPDPGPLSVEAPGARSWRSGRWGVVLAAIVLAIGAGVWLLLPR